jgi:membrane protein YdbS with pleckstrin-like domain
VVPNQFRRVSPLARLIPTPDVIVRSYLTTDEQMILVDQPSNKAFVVEASKEILLLGAVLVATGVWVTQGGSTSVAAIGFIAVDIILIILIIERLRRWFIRYVLTDFRVIRSWGIVTRKMAWIPWAKVTDVSISQSLFGRLLGYATVRIESANEASGLGVIKDLRDPHRFHRVISEMVQAKQGRTVPYWAESSRTRRTKADPFDIVND